MTARHGLGRGLGALIRDGVAPDAQPSGGVQRVPIDTVSRSSMQPRRTFEPEALSELALSIRRRGVLQPLLVRRSGDGYELIAGERRLRASVEAGLKDVPVIIMDAPDESALEMALVENLQREDLNVVEEADGYQLLIERFQLTHEQVSEQVGKSRSTVTNALRIRELPDDVKAMVSEGKLSAGHAKALTGLAIPEEQTLLAQRIAQDGLSVREVERRVRRAQRAPRKLRAARADLPTQHVNHLCERLHQHFGTRIRVTPTRTYANGKKGKGSIEIDFFSNDELDRILEIMGVEIE